MAFVIEAMKSRCRCHEAYNRAIWPSWGGQLRLLGGSNDWARWEGIHELKTTGMSGPSQYRTSL